MGEKKHGSVEILFNVDDDSLRDRRATHRPPHPSGGSVTVVGCRVIKIASEGLIFQTQTYNYANTSSGH